MLIPPLGNHHEVKLLVDDAAAQCSNLVAGGPSVYAADILTPRKALLGLHTNLCTNTSFGPMSLVKLRTILRISIQQHTRDSRGGPRTQQKTVCVSVTDRQTDSNYCGNDTRQLC